MSLPLPSSLSPSKVSSFKDCALAFRFSAIDRLPEPPSAAAMKGTLVHRSLELLFAAPAAQRTPEQARRLFDQATAEMTTSEEWSELGLDDEAAAAFLSDGATMLQRYFTLEDPTAFEPVGLELRLEVEVGGVLLRGIIDRLDLHDGELVVTDYKTGRAPSESQEMARLGGVHFYSLMCERVFGQRPREVQLLYLGANPQFIVARPSDQSTAALERKVAAIWTAVERACVNEDFRPKPSHLCSYCAFQQWCPAFGGDPAQAPRPVELTSRPPQPAAVPTA